MDLYFSVFFGIKDLKSFCIDYLFESRDGLYDYNFIKKDDMQELEHIYYNFDNFKSYVYTQKNSFIILVDNGIEGGTIYRCVKKGNFNAVRIVSAATNYSIDFYKDGNDRTIKSFKDFDDPWKFYQDGPQQPFEENDEYNERGATKKFNYAKLRKFCKNIGIDLDDPDFFKPVSEVFYIYRTNKVLEKKIVTYESRVEEKYKKIVEDIENSNVLLKDIQRDNDGNVLSDEICEIQWTNNDGVREYYVIDSTNEKILKRLNKIERSAKKKGVKIVIEYQVSPDFAH